MAKITRAGRRRLDAIDAAYSKQRNDKKKRKENARRDRNMLVELKGRSLPLPPHMLSWLSRKIGKPSSRIVQKDVDAILKSASAVKA